MNEVSYELAFAKKNVQTSTSCPQVDVSLIEGVEQLYTLYGNEEELIPIR